MKWASRRILAQSPNENVVLGKDGWLFYARDAIFPDFFGKNLFFGYAAH